MSSEQSRHVDEGKIPNNFIGEPLTDEDMPPCTSMMGHQLTPFNEEPGGPQTRMGCLHCNETRLVTPDDLECYSEGHEYPPWCVESEGIDG